MNAPSFLDQRRIDDTLRAMLRRSLFRAIGREPTEGELDVQVRREFSELSRQLRGGVVSQGGGEFRPAELIVRKAAGDEEGDGGDKTWLSPAELREAEATASYAKAQGIPSVLEAVRWYHAHHGGLGVAAALPQCVDEYLCVKQAEGLAEMTLAGYRSKLDRFAKAFPSRRPAEVSPDEIGRFIALAEHPTTRRDWWQTLFTFFGWCERMKYAPENPLPQALSKPNRIPSAALVLTPGEARAILRAAKHTDQVGFWVLGLFAGLRTQEIRRLQEYPDPWSLVRMSSRVIDLPNEVAKVHSRRIPILPVLGAWLKWVRRRDVPFFPKNHYVKCRRLRNAVMQERCDPMTARHRETKPNVKAPIWAFNVARRSYISYRLARPGANYAAISDEVGNSESVIRAHYARHVTAAAARALLCPDPGPGMSRDSDNRVGVATDRERGAAWSNYRG